VRFGILILPEDRWSIARERWIAAEQLGFDHAWTRAERTERFVMWRAATTRWGSAT
jgi:hypothetical protein